MGRIQIFWKEVVVLKKVKFDISGKAIKKALKRRKLQVSNVISVKVMILLNSLIESKHYDLPL